MSSSIDFELSRYPSRITASMLKSWIAQNDDAAQKRIADFVYHRLNHRYIVPLMKVPPEYKSGFLMMASACLMIETMQSFQKGHKETPRYEGGNSFQEFFERETAFFPGFADAGVNFYRNIRCGLLHQAETKGGYRIWRKGKLLDVSEKTINADAFLASLERCLDSYVNELRKINRASILWRRAMRKLRYICANCEH